jgi:hypothetical protein
MRSIVLAFLLLQLGWASPAYAQSIAHAPMLHCVWDATVVFRLAK